MSEDTKGILKDHYLQTYEKAERFVNLYSNYSESSEGNMCLIEIFDILITAQENEKDIEEVTGPDFNRFLKNVYHAFYPFSLMRYIYKTHLMSLFASLIITVFYTWANDGSPEVYSYINLYIVLIISYTFGDIGKRVVTKAAEKNGKIYEMATKRITSVLLLAIWMIFFAILTSYSAILFVDISTWAYIVIIILSCIPGVIYSIRNLSEEDTGIPGAVYSIRKSNKEKSITNKKDGFAKALIERLENKRDRINRKKIVKSEAALTNEDWCKLMKKRYRFYDFTTALVMVLYIVLISFITIDQFNTGFTAIGITALVILMVIVLFLSTYYSSRKIVYKYIYDLQKNEDM